MKAVPGFLGMDATLQWLVSSSVSLLAALVASSLLAWIAPVLGQFSSSEINPVDMLVVGRLVAIPILPNLVTLVWHADCLGAWVFMWSPCLHFARREIEFDFSAYTFFTKTLSRSDVCGVNVMPKTGRCLDAILARLWTILLSKLVHETFTIPAGQILGRRSMKLSKACGLLSYIWLVSLLLVPCLPLLSLLLLLLSQVHNELFYGSFALLWDARLDGKPARLTRVGHEFAARCML
eukprot:895481-Amphidinium_carterae.1